MDVIKSGLGYNIMMAADAMAAVVLHSTVYPL